MMWDAIAMNLSVLRGECGQGGVGGRENTGREGAGGGSGKERKVPNSKRREVRRKCAKMLNISRLKRA